MERRDRGIALLAKGTPVWIISIPALSAVSILLYFWLEVSYFIILAFILLVTFIPVIAFFRDPQRKIGDGVVSPADGKVMKVTRSGQEVEVSIFMNVHNVHVNRMPDDGQILKVEHIPGGFVPAFDKDSDRNERVIIEFKTKNGTWQMKQIAGAVARRIIPYVGPGDDLKKGERFGLIRFGSRVDITFRLPRGHLISVKVGDRVRAGQTSLSR